MGQPGPVGAVTRGTTAPRRLRRVDTWIAARLGHRLVASANPLVIDLGFGTTPVTTIELLARLGSVAGPGLRVVGLEIDTGRVAAAQASADPPSLAFTCGGFELAGLRPHLVRAMNVLRQYEEGQAAEAWAMMATALAPGGVLVEGTCDETGTLAAWVALDQAGPRSLTLSMDLEKISSPAVAATRLPKALIHHNVPGERVHDFLGALEHSWRAAAAYAAFGPRQRWWHAVSGLRDTGWPVIGGPRRWRQGEVTVRWNAVAPTREALRPLRGHNQP